MVDVGTNTVLYLLLAREGATYRALEEEVAPTRLGEGSGRGAPAAAAQERTHAAVAAFVSRARAAGAADVKVVGTEVLRKGSWRRGFVEAVRARCGVDLEVLTPGEEGSFALLAARRSLPLGLAPVVVADVGGGSAQVAREAGRGRPPLVESYPVGCVVVTERFLAGGGKAGWERARGYVRDRLAALGPARPGTKLVLAGGTAAALPGLEQRLKVYDAARIHGFTVTAAAVEAWAERVFALPLNRREALAGMPARRADIFPAGAFALAEIMKRLGCDAATVTAQGVRYGVAYKWFDAAARR